MTARTAGLAATADTAALTSGPRMASVMSVPSATTRSPTSRSSVRATPATASVSAVSIPRRSTAQATERYMAPVSRRLTPSRAARARDSVDLPDPAGPSMAMVTEPLTAAPPASRSRVSANPG